MGKGGRIACIFTPMALTIASFVCLALVEVSGWNKGTLNTLYFFQADLTNFTVPAGDQVIVQSAKSDLADIYQVHLWNYCQSGTTTSELESCSKRQSDFVFDPLTVWGFDISNGTAANTTDSSSSSEIDNAKSTAQTWENQILGTSGRDALDAYRTSAKWMFVAYQVSFWTTLATIAVGILAIFSRWGSLLTWILAILSTVFTFGAVLCSTIIFPILVSALNTALQDYGIHLRVGTPVLVTNWLGVAFSCAATLFWLFSVCCCSGRSNPHHRSNKGGLWNAESKGQGYGRGMQVEKTGGGGGGGYQRVSSPFVGGGHEHSDHVPLQDYAAPTGYSHAHPQQSAGYEPFRHG